MTSQFSEEQLEQLITRCVVKTIAMFKAPYLDRLAFNLREAAELTGASEKQLRLALARRDLPGRRIGKSYRITRSALLDWLDG